MRIGLISDLHSNREALNAVLEHLRDQDVDKIYCLGDVVVSATPSPGLTARSW